jgi:protein ImuB
MRRVMSLWLPRWPIDRRSGRQPAPDKPFVLALSVGNRRLVFAATAAAEGLGVMPGLPLTDARALHPALAVAEADPAGDARALQRLAQWCNRYSPWTAPWGADGVILDVTGCAHLRGGEASLMRDLLERLQRRSIAGRAAIADSAGAAWAVARCGSADSTVVPPGETRDVIAALPIAALRLDPVAALQLERLGLRRIGDLYALPRASLAARFGDGVAERLDQALGAAAEPLSPLPPAPARWVRQRFAEPIGTPEALAAATRDLLEALCRALGEGMLGARRLTLSCYRVDGEAAPVSIGTARPSRDPQHLCRLFAERLTEIDPGLGIEDMLLAASAVDRLAPAQLSISLSPRGEGAHRPTGRTIAVEAQTMDLVPRDNPFDRFAIEASGGNRRVVRSEHLEGRVRTLPDEAESANGGISSRMLASNEALTRSSFETASFAKLRTPPPDEVLGLPSIAIAPPQGGRGTRERNTVACQMARALLSAEGRDRDGTDAAELAALVDRLANRLGQQAVGCLAPQESHVPERAQRFAPVFAATKKSYPSGSPPRGETRPIRLLPRPEPIDAVAPVPDDPPIFFRWRRLQHRVRRADGPERLCGEWWRGAEEAAVLRDYYRVEDEAGRRFWLYRDGLYLPATPPRWFLHGLFA